MTPFEKLQTEKVWTVSLPNGAPLDFDCAKQNDLRFLYLNTLFNDRVQGIVQPTLEQQAILQAFIIDAQKKKFDSKALLPLYREKKLQYFYPNHSEYATCEDIANSEFTRTLPKALITKNASSYILIVDVEPASEKNVLHTPEFLNYFYNLPAHYTELSQRNGVHKIFIVPTEIAESKTYHELFNQRATSPFFKEGIENKTQFRTKKIKDDKFVGMDIEYFTGNHPITLTEKLAYQSSDENEIMNALKGQLDFLVEHFKNNQKESIQADNYLKQLIEEERENHPSSFYDPVNQFKKFLIKRIRKIEKDAQRTHNDGSIDMSNTEYAFAKKVMIECAKIQIQNTDQLFPKMTLVTLSAFVGRIMQEEKLTVPGHKAISFLEELEDRGKRNSERDNLPWMFSRVYEAAKDIFRYDSDDPKFEEYWAYVKAFKRTYPLP